jgi:hypothetical protein
VGWQDIVAVVAYRLGEPSPKLVLELDLRGGDTFVISDAQPGFGEVLERMAQELPEFKWDCTDGVRVLDRDTDPVVVWVREHR